MMSWKNVKPAVSTATGAGAHGVKEMHILANPMFTERFQFPKCGPLVDQAFLDYSADSIKAIPDAERKITVQEIENAYIRVFGVCSALFSLADAHLPPLWPEISENPEDEKVTDPSQQAMQYEVARLLREAEIECNSFRDLLMLTDAEIQNPWTCALSTVFCAVDDVRRRCSAIPTLMEDYNSASPHAIVEQVADVEAIQTAPLIAVFEDYFNTKGLPTPAQEVAEKPQHTGPVFVGGIRVNEPSTTAQIATMVTEGATYAAGWITRNWSRFTFGDLKSVQHSVIPIGRFQTSAILLDSHLPSAVDRPSGSSQDVMESDTINLDTGKPSDLFFTSSAPQTPRSSATGDSPAFSPLQSPTYNQQQQQLGAPSISTIVSRAGETNESKDLLEL